MKKFILKSTLFVLTVLALSHVRPLYLLDHDRYKRSGAGSEVYYSIHKSEQRNASATRILLGDSVARQIFSNITNNYPVYSLACNQAIGMVGQFILLDNYLRAGNHVDTVYLLLAPGSFANNLDQVYTYHYFLKPFYTREYLALLTETVIKQIHKIPYYYLSRYPHILTSNWAPDFVSKDKAAYEFLSPISAEYLVKIKELSVKHGFEFVMVAAPTKLSNRRSIENMKKEVVMNNLQDEFGDYFNNMLYLDDSEFGGDGVHIKDAPKYREYYMKGFMASEHARHHGQ